MAKPGSDNPQTNSDMAYFQSSLWSSFEESTGNKTYNFIGEGWSCMLVEKHSPVGKYLFSPYGPALADVKRLAPAIESIKSESKKLGVDWLRIEPVVANGEVSKLKAALPKFGHHAPRNIDPSATRILDLTMSVDELLASLSQTTRNHIHKNGREKTISFKTSTEPGDIRIFTDMLEGVASRSGAKFFPAEYFVSQAKVLMPAGSMRLELAYEGAVALGATIIHDYKSTAYYAHASSLPEARKKDVSELLLWQAILNAKARGNKTMDLFGVAPPNSDASHPWYGFSAFKEKFGGKVVEYAGTWDIPISYKYSLYRIARRLSSFVR